MFLFLKASSKIDIALQFFKLDFVLKEDLVQQHKNGINTQGLVQCSK